MSRNKMGIGILILAMLIGMALIPAVNAQQEDNFSEDEYNLPDYGPSIFANLKDDSTVIETRGIMPEMTEVKEQVEWLDKLETSIRSSKDELEPYMKVYGGPLVGFGIDYRGYIFVEFDEELGDTINKSTIDKMYNIIEGDAKKIEVSDIPVVFSIGEEEILESRTSLWTNMYGGIGITAGGYGSTISFAARDKSTGTYGFVMSAHAAEAAGGIGADVYQGGRKVGDVALYNGVFADAAWVEASNVVDNIYYTTDTNQEDVVDYNDPDLGNTVYKSGVATGLTSGTVTQEYVNQNSNTFGILYDQFAADYDSDGGDSGSPVFKMSPLSGLKLAGVHRSSTSTEARFSPVSGVESDLGVVPLKWHQTD